MADNTQSLDAIFGPGWQQKVAGGQPLQANGYTLVPNMGQQSADYSGSEWVPGLPSTPQSYAVFQGNGTGTNYLFGLDGNLKNSYQGSDQGVLKGVGDTIVKGAPLILGAMAGFGALGGLTGAGAGAAAEGAGAMSGMDMAADASSGFLSGTGYIPGAAQGITTAAYEAPTAVGGYSTGAAPGSLGSGSYGLEVPGTNLATGGALGSGTYGVGGMTGGAAGAGLGAGTDWLAASGGALGTLGGGSGALGAGAAAGADGGFLQSLGLGDISYGSLLGPAASLIGGAMGSSAAGKASDAQLQAAREAAALNEPFRQAGIQGMNRLTDLLGVSGRTGAEGYGSAAKDFGMSDFQADPGYAFRQAEGQKALERSAAARGGLLSGRAAKDTLNFSQGLASQEYGNAYNRYQTNRASKINPLQSLMGAGQTAANTIGDLTTQAGNASAAGTVGSANALTNGLSGAIGSYQQNELLNMLKNRSSMYGA